MAGFPWFTFGSVLGFLVCVMLMGFRPRWFCVFLVLGVQGIALGAPPSGTADSYQVKWSGAVLDGGGGVTWVPGEFTFKVTWNGTSWEGPFQTVNFAKWRCSIGAEGNVRITTDGAVPAGTEGNGIGSVSWRTGGTLADVPTLIDNSSSWGAKTIGKSTYRWRADGFVAPEVELTAAMLGTLTLTPFEVLAGTKYAGESITMRIVWRQADTLWRDANGNYVVPLGALNPDRLARFVGPPVEATEKTTATWYSVFGWRQVDIDWSAGVLLAARSNINGNGYGWNNSTQTPVSPVDVQDPPLRFDSLGIFVPTFGGYGVAALDVVTAAYDERPCVWNGHRYALSGETTAQPITVTRNYVGVRRVPGATVERWLLVIGTEIDSRKPYAEVRKSSGERVRFYAQGHLLLNATYFRYQADGYTVHPQLTTPDPAVATELGDEPGIQMYPVLTGNGDQTPFWPAVGLSPAALGSGQAATMPATRPTFVDQFLGEDVADGQTSILEGAKATTMPAEMQWIQGFALGESSTPATVVGDIEIIKDALVPQNSGDWDETNPGLRPYYELGGWVGIMGRVVTAFEDFKASVPLLFSLLLVAGTGLAIWNSTVTLIEGFLKSLGINDVSLVSWLRIRPEPERELVEPSGKVIGPWGKTVNKYSGTGRGVHPDD